MEKQIVSDVRGQGSNNTFLWITIFALIAFAIYRGERQVKVVEVQQPAKVVNDVTPVVPQAAPPTTLMVNTSYPQVSQPQVSEPYAYVSNTRFADIPRQQPIESPSTSTVIVDSGNTSNVTTVYNNYTQPTQSQTVVVESRPRGQQVTVVNQECDDRMKEHLQTVKHWNAQFFPKQ